MANQASHALILMRTPTRFYFSHREKSGKIRKCAFRTAKSLKNLSGIFFRCYVREQYLFLNKIKKRYREMLEGKKYNTRSPLPVLVGFSLYQHRSHVGTTFTFRGSTEVHEVLNE